MPAGQQANCSAEAEKLCALRSVLEAEKFMPAHWPNGFVEHASAAASSPTTARAVAGGAAPAVAADLDSRPTAADMPTSASAMAASLLLLDLRRPTSSSPIRP